MELSEMLIGGLPARDHADEFIQMIEVQIKNKLRPKQVMAIHCISIGKSVLLVFPTSYGKTLPARYLVEMMRDLGRKVIWLTPFKSLSREQLEMLSSYYKVLIITGDFQKNKAKLEDTDADVIIMTYEMFGGYMSNKTKRKILMSLDIGGIVIDEVHMITDDERGPKLERAIHILNKYHSNVQKVMLSATVGNPEKFARELHAELIFAGPEERPVPLKKEIRTYWKTRDPEEKADAKNGILRSIFNDQKQNNPQILVFCSSKKRCQDLASQFDGYNGWKMDYHHADVATSALSKIEQSFKEGEIRVIFCTTTLAAGINLPADICIIYDCIRFNGKKTRDEFLKSNEFIQMIGRCGRYKISKFGLAIAICADEEANEVDNIWNHPLDVISNIPSPFYLLPTILAWVGAGVDNLEDLQDMYEDVFAPPEKINMDDFRAKYDWLVEHGFIECEDGKCRVGRLGRLTNQWQIHPYTAMHFFIIGHALKAMNKVSYYQLFSMILDIPEFLDKIVVTSSSSDRTAVECGVQFLGNVDKRICKAFAMVFNDYLVEMFKRPSITVYGSDVISLKEDSSMIVSACASILAGGFPFVKDMEKLAKGCSVGCLDENLIGMMDIPSIGMTRASRLVNAGIKTLEDFIKCPNEKLKEILGKISIEKITDQKSDALDLLDGNNPKEHKGENGDV